MRRFLLLGVCLLVPTGLTAQTSTLKLGWDQTLVPPQTLTDVQAFVYTLKVNAAAPVVVAQTCVAGTPIKCTAPAPAGLKTGDVLTLTATNGIPPNGVSDPLTLGPGAAKPVSVTVIVTVTVP